MNGEVHNNEDEQQLLLTQVATPRTNKISGENLSFENLNDDEKDSQADGQSLGEEEEERSLLTQPDEMEGMESNFHIESNSLQPINTKEERQPFPPKLPEHVKNDEKQMFESSESETDSDEEVLTLMQRREQNILRNHRLLVEKGLASGITKKRTTKIASRESEPELKSRRRRGMLLHHETKNDALSTKTIEQIITLLEERYPCLSSQIRRVYALLSSAYAQATLGQPCYTPSPIFVTGSNGTGKTSVVRDIVDALKSQAPAKQCNRILSGYVNCDTLDNHSFDELAIDMYSQLVKQTSDHSDEMDTTGPKHSRKRRRKQQDQLKLTSISALREKDAEAFDKAEIFEEEIEERIERTRGRGKKKDASTEQNITVVQGSTSQAKNTIASQTAAWSLAESLRSLLGRRDCVFLILDRAERTLSFHANGSNFLAQFLLHVRSLGLNVSVVVISNSSLLHHMRVNLLASAERSSSSVATMFQPVRIHFPVAIDSKSVKKILNTIRLRNLIQGKSTAVDGDFSQVLFDSFLDTIIQHTNNVNTDIKEYVRICRSLWPLYVSPLGEAEFEKTLSSIDKSLSTNKTTTDQHSKTSVQRELLSFLDKRLHRHMQHVLDRGLFCLAMDSPCVQGGSPFLSLSAVDRLPQSTKMLLLAAFICQKNRPDKDRNLFVIERNGRKRSSKADTNSEAVAFGNDTQGDSLVSARPRPRTFALERLLSVFVSMITLHQTDGSYNCQGPETREGIAVGATPSFSANFSHLQEIGLVHECPERTSNESIRLTEPRYWCSLPEAEAQAIAKSINFSLDRYLS